MGVGVVVRIITSKWCLLPFFSTLLIVCISFFINSPTTNSKSHTITVANLEFLGELEQLDFENEAIAPLYLPTIRVNKREIGCSYHKKNLIATIKAEDEVIVDFTFCEVYTDPENFPLLGEAKVLENNGKIIIYYRMTDKFGCIVVSDSITEQELVKIISSFTIRHPPKV